MRNLKRVLSLSLASVMLLGMMVIGTSAATDYPDVDYSEDNVEAIEVLQAVDVMTGYDDGGFHPGDEVTRAQMARIMAALMDLDYDYYIGANPFTDMKGHWAEAYAAACYANGIIAGRTTTTYDPEATVTAVEAAAMLMRALGYFQNKAVDYPDGFEISTIKQAGKINLFDRVDAKTDEPMTRNDVAQLILNTLQSGMVEPSNSSKIDVTVGDAQVTIGSSNYVYVVSRDLAVGNAINKHTATAGNSTTGLEGPILDLGEKLYDGKLKLTEYTTDVFGRPARHWEYDSKAIGTYVKDELLKQEWTVKVTGKMLYDLLTKSTIDDYDFVISIDGETEKDILGSAYFTEGNLVRTNTETVGATGKGVLTQVYVDPYDGANGTVYISIINTYLAKAITDYSEKKDEATFEVWKLGWQGTGKEHLVKQSTNVNLTVKGEDFDITDVEEDDIVLVCVAEGEIQGFITPEVIDSTEISSFKKTDWVNAEGTQYDYANTARYDLEVLDEYDDNNMKDTLYRIYLDQYGYLIGIEIVEAADNYVFLAGLDTNAYNLGNKRAEANVIFTDGTSATVTVNLEKSKAYKDSIKWINPVGFTPDAAGTAGEPFTDFTQAALWNTWCTYSVDANGVYTLTEVASSKDGFTTNDNGKTWTSTRSFDKVGQGEGAVGTNTVIDTKRIGLNGISVPGFATVYGNDETVYITASLTKIHDARGLRPGDSNGDPNAVIISGVDSVVTGVRNASLDIWNTADVASRTDYKINVEGTVNTDGSASGIIGGNTSNGVYTLFNDKGYVIAAVVVGEDNGASSSYAYIYGNDPVIYEGYDKETGKWTWRADAIVNGELVVLEEVADSRSELNSSVERNNWYEVKYKADGTVRTLTLIDPETAPTSAHTYDAKIFCTDAELDPTDIPLEIDTDHVTSGRWPKFVGKIEYVEYSSIDNDGKLLLFEDLHDNTNYKISAKALSLQVTTDTGVSKGFSVASDARVWLIQDDWASINGLKYMNTRIDCGNGQSGLKQAISELNLYDPRDSADSAPFQGYISAIFENGRATTVIIYEVNPNLIDQGTTGTGTVKVSWDVNDYSLEYHNFYINSERVDDIYVGKDHIAYFYAPVNAKINITAKTGWNADYGDDGDTVVVGQCMYNNKMYGRLIRATVGNQGGSLGFQIDNHDVELSSYKNTYTITINGEGLNENGYVISKINNGATITITAKTGYEITAVESAPASAMEKYVLSSDGKTATVTLNEVTSNVTLNVTTKKSDGSTTTPPGGGEEDDDKKDTVEITINGSAKFGENYTATGVTVSGDKYTATVGDSIVITPVRKIAVRINGDVGTVSPNRVGNPKTIEVTADLKTITINIFEPMFNGDSIGETEVWETANASLMTMAAIMPRAVGDTKYVVIRLADVPKLADKTYVVLRTETAAGDTYEFGKDTTQAMRDEIIEGLKEIYEYDGDWYVDDRDIEATDEQIKAWKGEGTGGNTGSETPGLTDPGEAVPMPVAVATSSTAYTINFHGSATISSSAREAGVQAILDQLGYTSYTWIDSNNKVLQVSKEDGSKKTINITYQRKTAIYYNDVVVNWVNYEEGARDIAVNAFTARTRVIGSAAADTFAVPGSPSTTALVNGKYTVNVDTGTNNNYYFRDAFEIKWDNKNSDVADATKNGSGELGGTSVTVKSVDGTSVRLSPATATNGTGTDDKAISVALAEGEVYLTINGRYAAGASASGVVHLRVNNDSKNPRAKMTQSGTTPVTYEDVKISSADAKNGVVTIGEYGAIVTVKVDGETDYGYSNSSKNGTVKFNTVAGAAYIPAFDASGIDQVYDDGTKVAIADKDGVLEYPVDASDAYNGTIELSRVYRFTWDATNVATDVYVLADKPTSTDKLGTGETTAPLYVVPGATVVLKVAEEDKGLESKTGQVDLSQEVNLTTTDTDTGAKQYYYSFVMPKYDVMARDISLGDELGDVKLVIDGSGDSYNCYEGNDLNEPEGTATAGVTLTGAGTTTNIIKNSITWYKDLGKKDFSTAEKLLKADGTPAMPKNMKEIRVSNATSGAAGAWVITFYADDLKAVEAGTYWFEITLEDIGVSAHCMLVVDEIKTEDDSATTSDIEDLFETGDTVFLGENGATIDENLTLKDGQTLDTDGAELTLDGGDLTVKTGATLRVSGDVTVGSDSEGGTVRLAGGTLILEDGCGNDISWLDPESTGTIVFPDGKYVAVDNANAEAEDADTESEGEDGDDDDEAGSATVLSYIIPADDGKHFMSAPAFDGTDLSSLPVVGEIKQNSVMVSGLELAGGKMMLNGDKIDITKTAAGMFGGSSLRLYRFVFKDQDETMTEYEWDIRVTIKDASGREEVLETVKAAEVANDEWNPVLLLALSDKVTIVTFEFISEFGIVAVEGYYLVP